ncbi:DNA topoisomerase I, partial [Candidatus Bathyarchaeota archaeon]|nr:DNA topoisomerase I [Candidatus Bathyarchaeota archaeon]
YYPIFNVKWVAAYLFNKRLIHTKRWIDAFSKLSEGASEFISGTDYDIEGEVIGYTILKYACGGKEEKAKRMVFSTLTTQELRESYRNVSPTINFGLAEAGETRHIVDFLWGINLSRALTLAVKNTGKHYANLSTGRVQAPTLKFLVDRETEIQSFVPAPYWKIRAKVKIGEQLYTVEYERPRIENELKAKEIAAKCSRQKGIICDVATTTSKYNPPVPFDLGTLQTEAYRIFRYSPSTILRSAEKLYLQALISYPRTSSQKIPPTINCRTILSSLNNINKYQLLTSKLLLNKRLKPNEGRKEDTAHPAIIPTGNLPESRLDSISLNLFDLVVKRFLAVFAPPAVRESVKATLKVSDETFYLDGLRTLEKGWLEFYEPYARSEENIIPPVHIDEEILFSGVHSEEAYTSPPPRYNPSSLLKIMEEQNIGTKATRATIIDTLYERGYIIEERLVVTDLGFRVVSTLEKYCKDVVSPDFTRILEDRMDKIEQGTDKEKDVLLDSISKLKNILTEFKQNQERIGLELSDALQKVQLEKQVIGQCPICKTGKLVVLYSKKTKKRFVGCTNFKQDKCNAAFPLPQSPYKIRLPKKICTTCSWPMIEVSTRKRRFWNLCLNP